MSSDQWPPVGVPRKTGISGFILDKWKGVFPKNNEVIIFMQEQFTSLFFGITGFLDFSPRPVF
jgi:hypothetical protein